MKKLIYIIIAVIGSFLISCEAPLEDTFNELDTFNDEQARKKAEDEALNGTLTIDTTFTLANTDYAAIKDDEIELKNAFATFDEATIKIPNLLKDKFPSAKDNSKAVISFEIFDGNPEELNGFSSARFVKLATSDYPTFGTDGFLINEDPEASIPTILKDQSLELSPDQSIRVQYDVFTEEAREGEITLFQEFNFETSFNGWQTLSVEGDTRNWRELTGFIEMNGFERPDQFPQEDWLISPQIDLTGKTNTKFQINQSIRFGDDSMLKILVSSDFTGNQATATWNEINLSIKPVNNNDEALALSEDFDLSAYDNQKINIAFQYKSTETASTRWRIQSVNLKTAGIAGNRKTLDTFYKVDESGDFEIDDSALYLSREDYNSMGEEFGQPGRFDNFSFSVAPENYLPVFLNLRFPFAQEEDMLFLVYRFFVGGDFRTVTRGNNYTFKDGSWKPSLSISQFRLKNREWIADNAIEYTFTNDDYSNVATEFITKPGFESVAGNLNDFGNFNRGRSTSWQDDQIVEAIGFILKQKFPDTEIGQAYLITVEIFNGSRTTENINVILNDDGNYILN